MERKEFKISITMKNVKKRNEGKGQQQEKKKQKTRGKIVTVARQRALNIVKSHVKMSKILPNLFLSSEKAVNEENVKQNNIKANVDLSKLRVVERRIKDSKKIKCLIIDVNDDPKQAAILQRNLSNIFKFIKNEINNNHNVVVNCQAGISRSATVVIGYIMHTQRLSYDQAYNIVKKRRPIINPNKGFVNMLKYTMKQKVSSSSS